MGCDKCGRTNLETAKSGRPLPPPASRECVECRSEMVLCGACKPWKEPHCRGCEAAREAELRRREEEVARACEAQREKERRRREVPGRPGWVKLRNYQYAAEEETFEGRRIGRPPVLTASSPSGWKSEGFSVKEDQVGHPHVVRTTYFPGSGVVTYYAYRRDQVEPTLVLGPRRLRLGLLSIPTKELTKTELEMAAEGSAAARAALWDSLKERGVVGDGPVPA